MLNNKLQFTINSSEFDSINFVNDVSCTSLILFSKDGKDFFFKIPSLISFFKKESNIIFFVKSEKDLPTLNTFENLIKNSISVKFALKKKLSLQGLGFKINIIERNISFKLGYSHLINLDLPKSINRFFAGKRKVIIESSDKIKLGNFAYKIFSLRKYDSYKGKGFSMMKVKKKLKVIKKK